MNIADFQQLEGFPLRTNTVKFMQDAYSQLQAFGALAGEKSIISGCVEQGNSVSDGFVFYNGELLAFKGALKEDKVIIIEEVETDVFKDQSIKDVYKTRYITFGDDGNGILWSEFKRYYINQPIKKEIKWVGRDITNADLAGTGWFIANGTNGTDNVLGRMIVGKNSTETEFNTIGKKGGEKTHKLTVSEMPKHRFQLTQDVVSFYGEANGNGNGGDGLGTKVKYTNYLGGDQPHNNLPPYIVMIPIQFIG